MLAASPAKLRNGSWGARVQGTARKGDTVQITTRSGKSWTATVTKVLWKGDGITLCETASTTPKPRKRTTRTGCGCGSVEEFEKSTDCWNCRHDRY